MSSMSNASKSTKYNDKRLNGKEFDQNGVTLLTINENSIRWLLIALIRGSFRMHKTNIPDWLIDLGLTPLSKLLSFILAVSFVLCVEKAGSVWREASTFDKKTDDPSQLELLPSTTVTCGNRTIKFQCWQAFDTE